MMVVESMRSYNEDGFVLGGAILISAILILAGGAHIFIGCRK